MTSLPSQPLYRSLAIKIEARNHCHKTGNAEWFGKHSDAILRLVNRFMPSGSGIDSGTTIDIEFSRPNRIIFNTSFHHMDENGSYDGWTKHDVIVTPSLMFEMHVLACSGHGAEQPVRHTG